MRSQGPCLLDDDNQRNLNNLSKVTQIESVQGCVKDTDCVMYKHEILVLGT